MRTESGRKRRGEDVSRPDRCQVSPIERLNDRSTRAFEIGFDDRAFDPCDRVDRPEANVMKRRDVQKGETSGFRQAPPSPRVRGRARRTRGRRARRRSPPSPLSPSPSPPSPNRLERCPRNRSSTLGPRWRISAGRCTTRSRSRSAATRRPGRSARRTARRRASTTPTRAAPRPRSRGSSSRSRRCPTPPGARRTTPSAPRTRTGTSPASPRAPGGEDQKCIRRARPPRPPRRPGHAARRPLRGLRQAEQQDAASRAASCSATSASARCTGRAPSGCTTPSATPPGRCVGKIAKKQLEAKREDAKEKTAPGPQLQIRRRARGHQGVQGGRRGGVRAQRTMPAKLGPISCPPRPRAPDLVLTAFFAHVPALAKYYMWARRPARRCGRSSSTARLRFKDKELHLLEGGASSRSAV